MSTLEWYLLQKVPDRTFVWHLQFDSGAMEVQPHIFSSPQALTSMEEPLVLFVNILPPGDGHHPIVPLVRILLMSQTKFYMPCILTATTFPAPR